MFLALVDVSFFLLLDLPQLPLQLLLLLFGLILLFKLFFSLLVSPVIISEHPCVLLLLFQAMQPIVQVVLCYLD